MSEHPQRLLLIFLKEPIPGKVKTRIAQSVGDEEATLIYKALVSTLLAQLQWIPHCHYRFCFAPADAELAMHFWLLPDLAHRISPQGIEPLEEGVPSVDFMPQVEGDLGDRLAAAFSQGFEEGFSQVAAIGADCPTVSARWIDTAFMSARPHDATYGPTPDGGYYLLILNQFCPEAFAQIPWSTSSTLETSLQHLQGAGYSTHLLPTMPDVDHEADWQEALQGPIGHKLKKTYDSLKRAAL